MSTHTHISRELQALADPAQAVHLARFFKTGVGEYGHGDVFLGVRVPATRSIVRRYARESTLDDACALIQSRYHEVRLAGLILMVWLAQHEMYPVSELAHSYMSLVTYISNWDLVDTSAEYIIGPYLHDHLHGEPRQQYIDECVASTHLWTNRIIILASHYDLKAGEPELTLEVVTRLMHHPHDLIHKACGWMLREMGQRVSRQVLLDYLDRYAIVMPRTMLRYAIEHLDRDVRVAYMKRT